MRLMVGKGEAKRKQAPRRPRFPNQKIKASSSFSLILVEEAAVNAAVNGDLRGDQ